MPNGWFDKKLIASILLVLLIAAVFYEGMTYYLSTLPTPPTKYTYMTGLTAEFSIINGTSFNPITSGVLVGLYNSYDTPFAYASVVTPITYAIYSSTAGYWQINGLSAGSYQIIVTTTSGKSQPVSALVTVPGTNDNTKPVVTSPSTITIYNTATLGFPSTLVANLTTTLGAINNGPSSTLVVNGSKGKYWEVSWTISVAGSASAPAKLLSPVYLWLTDLTGHIRYDEIVIDGVVAPLTQVTTTATATGSYSGWYAISSSSWTSGTSHTVTLYMTKTSTTTTTSPTLTLTVAGNFGVLNSQYRTWTDSTTTVTINNV